MMRLIIVMLCLCLSIASAQAEPTPLKWPSHRVLAERLSDIFVYTDIGMQTVHSLRSDDRRHAFTCQAINQGVALGAELLAKYTVHRTRPDDSNDHSFFSAHTANSMVNSGWDVQVGVPIAIGAGYMRMAANKHYLTDVLTGAGVGWLSSRVCQ